MNIYKVLPFLLHIDWDDDKNFDHHRVWGSKTEMSNGWSGD